MFGHEKAKIGGEGGLNRENHGRALADATAAKNWHYPPASLRTVAEKQPGLPRRRNSLLAAQKFPAPKAGHSAITHGLGEENDQ